MASDPVRFGILGCAGIAAKVCVAFAEADNATVHAVGSRSKEKAVNFVAENCPGACTYDSYEAVLDDPKVQAVYIPLPTGMRAEWVKKAAAKKKHILVEKPISNSAEETKEIFACCQAEGVQIMDNTMFMHNPRLSSMKAALDNANSFGKVYHVVSAFSLPLGLTDPSFAAGNIRMKKETEPLGALGDLGWYCSRITLWAFDFEQPEAVSCHFLEETDEGVPIRVVANMKFADGRSASFDCSFKHAWRQWVEFASEKCTLRVEDFVIPAKLDVCSYIIGKSDCGEKALTFPYTEVEKKDCKDKPQHTLLVEKFASIVSSGQVDEFWSRIAQQTNLLILSLVSSAGKGGAWVDTSSNVEEPPVKKAKGN